MVDASVIGPLLIADEADQLHPGVTGYLIRGNAIVPQHWRIEVASLGRSAVRRGRVQPAELLEGLAILAKSLPAEDDRTNEFLWDRTLKLANQHDLTIYDAAYLELAKRMGLPLVSADKQLRSAARAEHVDLLDA